MEPFRIGPGGGTIFELIHITEEPVSGPEVANKAFLYYLKGIGFRVKLFGADGEPLTEANVSQTFEAQTSDPSPLTGKGQIYAKVSTPDGNVELFYRDDAGNVRQLTPSVSKTYVDAQDAAEATARAAAVSSEATTRGNADTTLQANINSEAMARANADTTLQSNIDTETANAYHKGDAALTPSTDDAQSLGTVAKRLAAIFSRFYKVFGGNADTQPSVEVADKYIKVGKGGSTAPDSALINDGTYTKIGLGTTSPVGFEHINYPTDDTLSSRMLTARVVEPTNSNTGAIAFSDILKYKSGRIFAQTILRAQNTGDGSECGAWSVQLRRNDVLVTALTIDKDTDIATLTSILDMNMHRVQNVSDPVNPQDAATKQYVTDHAGGAAELILVEQHVAVSDETSYTFSGLDGDTDGVYYISWSIVKALTSNMNVFLRPQGSNTNLSYCGIATVNGGAYIGYNGSDWLLHSNSSGAAGNPMQGEATFWAKKISTNPRTMRATVNDYEGGSGPIMRIVQGIYNDGVTNITSLQVISSLASGIKAGSVISLYKRPHG